MLALKSTGLRQPSGVPEPQQELQTGLEVVDGFNRWFAVVLADSSKLVEKAYRLRYQVYCVEHPFEDPDDNPGGLEKDAYDDHAIHSLIIHRPTNAAAGTVRLILPQPEKIESTFPIQEFCSPEQIAAAVPGGLEKAAEISRFAVTKQFLRRSNEVRYPDVGWTPDKQSVGTERRQHPFLMLGLLRATLMMSVDQGIEHLLAVMEPALMRLMRRFGIQFEPIGPLVEYHGTRQPCVADLSDLVRNVREHREEFWLVGTDQGRIAEHRP